MHSIIWGIATRSEASRSTRRLSLTKRAVALKPSNGYYIDSLGWALFKSGKLTEALTELKRAVALVEDDPVLYEHLGDIYATQRNLSKPVSPGFTPWSLTRPTAS